MSGRFMISVTSQFCFFKNGVEKQRPLSPKQGETIAKGFPFSDQTRLSEGPGAD
jgi:hypothetical protein